MLRKHVPQPAKQHPRRAHGIVGVHVVPALHLCRLHLPHQRSSGRKVLFQLCKAGMGASGSSSGVVHADRDGEGAAEHAHAAAHREVPRCYEVARDP